MSKKTSKWENEFYQTFAWMNSPLYLGKIKTFISDLLAKEKMGLVERIERMVVDRTDWVKLDLLLDALKSEIQEKEEVEKGDNLED